MVHESLLVSVVHFDVTTRMIHNEAMCGSSKWHTAPCAIWSALGRPPFQFSFNFFFERLCFTESSCKPIQTCVRGASRTQEVGMCACSGHPCKHVFFLMNCGVSKFFSSDTCCGSIQKFSFMYIAEHLYHIVNLPDSHVAC